MANDTSLKELIVSAQNEEAKEEYKKYVTPMQPDIDKFADTLRSYCLANKILEVRIIYRVKNASTFGFFSKSITGNRILISGCNYTEVEEAWEKLLTKWYFTENGPYLLYAISNTVFEKGFLLKHDDEGWGWMKDMVHFTVR